MSSTYQAPKFHAYLEHIEGRSVYLMPRVKYQQLKLLENKPVLIDVSQTPMKGVARDAFVVAAVAQRTSTATARMSIIRHDPKDAPTPYNVDHYEVWEDLPSYHDYEEIVLAASTRDDDNLRGFFRTNVFIVKEKPGKDHWLSSSELPALVRTVVRST
jgi:hypothetical protein